MQDKLHGDFLFKGGVTVRVISITQDGVTNLCLEGELDHHAAKTALVRIGQIIDSELPRSVVLDLCSLSFMDSSGIAVVVHTFRRIKEFGGSLSVVNIPPHAFRIFRAAGLTRMIPMSERIQKSERRTLTR